MAFFQLPDGAVLQKDCTIVDGNIHCELDNNILSQSGKVNLEFLVKEGIKKTTTPAITLDVDKSIDRNGAVQTVIQWDIIDEMVNFPHNEDERAAAEDIRISNENARKSAETTRANQEVVRLASEAARVANETTRGTNEAARVSAEATRVANENARVTKETARVTEFNTIKADYETYKAVMIDESNVANLQSQINSNTAQLAENQTSIVSTNLESVVSLSNSKAGVAELQKIEGRVPIINILGDAGDCEDFSKWVNYTLVLDTSIKMFGNTSFKGTGAGQLVYKDIPCDQTHKYLLSAYFYLASYTSGSFRLDARDYGANTGTSTAWVDTTKLNQWQRKSQIVTGKANGGIRIYAGSIIDGVGTFYIDGVMLYDLTSLGLDHITDVAELERKLPFVNGVASLNPVSIKCIGKNLLNIPKQTILVRGLTINIDDDGVITVNGTATSTGFIILSNKATKTSYPLNTFSKTYVSGGLNGSIGLDFTDFNNISGNGIAYRLLDDSSNYTGNKSVSSFYNGYNINNNYNGLFIPTLYVNSGAVFTNYKIKLQLECGTTATTYEPYQSSEVLLPVECADTKSIGTVKDYTDLYAKKHVKKITDWVTLNDYLSNLVFDATTYNKVGYKRIVMTSILNSSYSNALGIMVKYDSTLLNNADTTFYSNSFFLGSNNSNISLSILNADTGFTDSYTNPSILEWKAYFFGWKMCKSDGSAWDGVATKYWKKITDGTGITSTLPTASYTGYTPYRMIYQLANPIETDLSTKLDNVLESYPNSTLIVDSNIPCNVEIKFPTNLASAVKAIGRAVDQMTNSLGNVWKSLLSLADRELRMKSTQLLSTETTADLKAKINEILNIWR